MKSNKGRGKSLAAAILIATAMLAAACGNNDGLAGPDTNAGNPPVESNDPGSNAGLETPDNNASDSDAGGADTNTDSGTNDADLGNDGGQSSDEDGVQLLEGTGTFTGLIDSHSVEIETAEGAAAFQFDAALTDTVSGIESGTRVRFEYTVKELDVSGEKVQQNWLTSITAV